MNHIYQIYLQMLGNTFEGQLQAEDAASLYELAKKHFTSPFLLPYMSGSTYFQDLKYQTKMMMFHYYQMEHFTRKTVELLEAEDIDCFLLKGISLAAYYPLPEYRKLGDLDLYIPDPEKFSKAQKLLEENGYLLDPEVSDHHVTYSYTFPKTGRTYILELHFCIVGKYQFEKANRVVDAVYNAQTLAKYSQTIHDKTYQVLPPTEYTFYMIHHMLKHYLYSGFGIRLLYDFAFYLNAHFTEVNFSKIHAWCSDSHILHLYEIILESCRMWLNLAPEIDPEIHCDKKACQSFLKKVLSDHDMGTNESRALVNSGSYKKVTPVTYFKEGHLQMLVRFPNLGKYPPLWPALWIITCCCFLHNTYRLRHTTLRQTLRDFKDTNHATRLIQIFDNHEER